MKIDIIGRFMLVMTIMSLLVACHNSEEPVQPERASFELTSVKLSIGENFTDKVLNATAVEVISCPDIVSVSVNGIYVTIIGKKAGSGRLAVKADGHAIYCEIEVYDGGSSSMEPDDKDLSAFIADETMRAQIGTINWRFDEPGTLMMISHNGLCLEMRDFATGQEFRLQMSEPIMELSDERIPDSAGCNLYVNGTELEVESCDVIAFNERCLWLRLSTHLRGICLIAIDRTL